MDRKRLSMVCSRWASEVRNIGQVTVPNRWRNAALLTILIGSIGGMAAPASAGLVTISGGFTSYTGPTENHTYPTSITLSTQFSLDGGSDISLAPTVALPGDPADSNGSLFTNSGIGIGTLDFTSGGASGPAHSVEFWRAFGAGVLPPNAVTFTPNPNTINVISGAQTPFLIGTFSFTNGGWFGSLPVWDGVTYSTYTYPESTFHFRAVASLDGNQNHVFESDMNLITTGTADPDPTADVDYFYFVSRQDLGRVGAFEAGNLPPGGSNMGSIELWGHIGSLIPDEFTNPQGGAVLARSSVPEPQTWALLLTGLLAAGMTRCRTGNA